jgi:hypothetical protein
MVSKLQLVNWISTGSCLLAAASHRNMTVYKHHAPVSSSESARHVALQPGFGLRLILNLKP